MAPTTEGRCDLGHGVNGYAYDGGRGAEAPVVSRQAVSTTALGPTRDGQWALDAEGVAITILADPGGTGPAHVVLANLDGSVILLDQHVPVPA